MTYRTDAYSGHERCKRQPHRSRWRSGPFKLRVACRVRRPGFRLELNQPQLHLIGVDDTPPTITVSVSRPLSMGSTRMIHAHSLGRAARYYPERTALASGGTRLTFRELHDRVGSIASELRRHGFGVGDRLALLLPNEPMYIELVYACSWLGVIAVPVNTRLTASEIDHVLADASPRGLIRHSSLPVPTVQLSWQRVLDQEPLDVRSDSQPGAIYDP